MLEIKFVAVLQVQQLITKVLTTNKIRSKLLIVVILDTHENAFQNLPLDNSLQICDNATSRKLKYF